MISFNLLIAKLPRPLFIWLISNTFSQSNLFQLECYWRCLQNLALFTASLQLVISRITISHFWFMVQIWCWRQHLKVQWKQIREGKECKGLETFIWCGSATCWEDNHWRAQSWVYELWHYCFLSPPSYCFYPQRWTVWGQKPEINCTQVYIHWSRVTATLSKTVAAKKSLLKYCLAPSDNAGARNFYLQFCYLSFTSIITMCSYVQIIGRLSGGG